MSIIRGFDHHDLWTVLDKAFEGHGVAVVPGKPLHYTPTYEAKQIVVSALLSFQHERTLMSSQQFNKIFGSIAAVGFMIALVTVILYFIQLPIFNRIDVAWVLFYGILAGSLAATALIIRAIWDTN